MANPISPAEKVIENTKQLVSDITHRKWRACRRILDENRYYLVYEQFDVDDPELAEHVLHSAQLATNLMNFDLAVILYRELMCILCRPRDIERHLAVYQRAVEGLVHNVLFTGHVSLASDVLIGPKSSEQPPERKLFLTSALGRTVAALGFSLVENSIMTSAEEPLELALDLLEPDQLVLRAKVLSLRGYCQLCSGRQPAVARATLGQALALWRGGLRMLELPLVVSTMRHYVEACLRDGGDDITVCEEMTQLHLTFQHRGLGLLVVEALTYLGTVAFHKEKELQATRFFEQAIALSRRGPQSDESRDELRRLLRYLGVASYNAKQFSKAARAYQDCLSLLGTNQNLSVTRANQVADCYASLGFTYSRLRDFDSMLKYYELALEMQHSLMPDDLELIETNIGSLYHVRAALCDAAGDTATAARFYSRAETAFTRALNYSWKSFPFINYGYYLVCRGRHLEAASTLQQGYLNGLEDRDTVEFDHTEDAILLPELRRELAGREDIRAPAAVISLYLKVRAQVGLGARGAAAHSTAQLQALVEGSGVEGGHYFTEGYGEGRMLALCLSLLGYSWEAVGAPLEAARAFTAACDVMPGYVTAQENLERITAVSQDGAVR